MKFVRMYAGVLWLATSAGLGAWAVLFATNYLNASVEAYGPLAQHLGYLRVLFWRYIAAGGALFAGWLAFGITFLRGRQASHGRERADQRHGQVRAGTG